MFNPAAHPAISNMVKYLALAKTIEEQFVKRIVKGGDQGIVSQILAPSKGATVVTVAVCQDGRGHDNMYFEANLKNHLQILYSHWGYEVEVKILSFSFVGNVIDMMDILLSADIFYLAGVFTVSQSWIDFVKPGGHAYCLVEALQSRVQYHSLAFIGVCGGALISGASNRFGLTPLDVLQGATIAYRSNCSAAAIDAADSSTTNEFILTTGCGIAIYVWKEHIHAVSFPVVKNHTQWWAFAERNSIALQDALVQKVRLPEAYRPESSSRDYWYFSIAGYMYRHSKWTAVDGLTRSYFETLAQ